MEFTFAAKGRYDHCAQKRDFGIGSNLRNDGSCHCDASCRVLRAGGKSSDADGKRRKDENEFYRAA